jgi:acetylornithine deacetylase/succinyl-diaminopimelate desuccinylase-like protein
MAWLIIGLGAAAFAQPDSTSRAKIDAILGHPKYREAIAFLSRDHERIVEENVRLTEIAAPSFKEAAKADAFLEMLKPLGLSELGIDQEGNVTGIRKGTGEGPLIAIAAHLDTVFPEGTDVKVKRDGSKLRAPGVADDTRGLAVILAMLRAMEAAKIETASDILFVASVGEEGLGDLRGVKYLFLKGPYKDRIKTFIALDGVNPSQITTTAVGSRRYRLTFTGPGGHSYSAFGLVNPMYAAGQFMVDFAKTQVPDLTTYNVGVIGGGTSVNSIPLEAWMEVDMRAVVPDELARLESRMKELALAAAETENRTRSTKNGRLEVKMQLIGDRPAGSTTHPLLGTRLAAGARSTESATKNTELVELAWAAVAAHGFKPELNASSTDANIAMSLGIPAITIASGSGDRMHSLDEWLEVDKETSLRQLGIAMTTVLAAAGMQP